MTTTNNTTTRVRHPETLFEQVVKDPCTSAWLHTAIHYLSERDPVDAMNDAEMLVRLCQERIDVITASVAN